MKSAIAIIALALLAAACADKPPPPLASPDPSFCVYYDPFNYAEKAAANENVETLRKHVGNETRYVERCISSKDKPGGPR